ncbi:MAG: NAD(P)-binding domain-containing protein, partial [Phycisphaeraceae bacterium]|nr:NAD(P)-binding domain-containing protein [Phycisphaeraceae bacterium]
MRDKTLGLIGAGNMAEAIVRAAINASVVPAEQIIASDPSEERRAVFADLGVEAVDDTRAVIGRSQQVLLAVKPQTLPVIASDLAAVDRSNQVVLSIMAGVSVAKTDVAMGGPGRVVRIMPNTPLMAGEGMAALASGPGCEPGDDELAMRLFSAAGKAIRV